MSSTFELPTYISFRTIITHMGSALPYDRIDANHSYDRINANHSSSKHMEEITYTQPICDESSSNTSCS
jgi:hypothetical protein